ncbi:hypothetical protein [Ottowia sp.]|uniref:hypothetical protein n=1 Tax=Ottowia sp. TaxID=1898956 RepID=UPI0025DFB3C0|nr:hypothetical protein [Ottowia sp.]
MPKSKPHDEAMAELYRSNPGLALEVIQGIVADDDQAELLTVLRQMSGASAGVESSPIIESLRGELAALHRAGAVSRETVQAFEALLTPDRSGDRRMPP